MEFVSHCVSDTYELAKTLASRLEGGEILLLGGGLGAGKTTFTKGLAKALGVKREVVSPTFTLVREYSGEKLKLYHFDLYRVESEDELQELGLDEYFASDAVTVIEWNKPGVALPGKTVKIDICDKGGEERLITVEGL